MNSYRHSGENDIVGTGKDTKPRKTQVSKEELELRDALWREKNPRKKAKIRKLLEALK